MGASCFSTRSLFLSGVGSLALSVALTPTLLAQPIDLGDGSYEFLSGSFEGTVSATDFRMADALEDLDNWRFGTELYGETIINFIDRFTIDGGLVDYGTQILAQSGGDGIVIQTGGQMNGIVEATLYQQSGGVIGDTVRVDTFEHSGGVVTDWAQVFAKTYRWTGVGAAVAGGGLIIASDLFDINSDSDLVFDGGLQGSGKLIKSGTALVTLASEGGNGITGDIEVLEGTLAYYEGWGATRSGDLTIAEGALFRSTGGVVTNFLGALKGDGRFEQTGGSHFGVGGDVDIAELGVTNGLFRVGTAYFETEYGPEEGASTDASFGTIEIGSEEGTLDGEPYAASGAIEVERGSSLTADHVVLTAGTLGEAETDQPDLSAAKVTIGTFTQSGGIVSSSLTDLNVGTYDFSGGVLEADVAFSDLFNLSAGKVTTTLTGDGTAAIAQSGGTMAGKVTGVSTYAQSGGTMASILTGLDRYTWSGGTITGHVGAETYELAGGTLTDLSNITFGSTFLHSGGTLGLDLSVGTYRLEGSTAVAGSERTITASSDFELAVDSGAATVDAKLSGAGKLTKSGAGIVVVTNGGSDFAGGVAIEAGTLNAMDDALPDNAAVDIAVDATLQVTVGAGRSVIYTGAMTGENGTLVKDGAGTLTLAGSVYLGELDANAGRLNIGTGTSENEVSFESAVIEAGATVYVAQNATLTIRVPNNIVNNGTLINDGTVNDDLDNNKDFVNNNVYNADVASNTGKIDNNSPGVWTGDILTNAGSIGNWGGTWNGDILANASEIWNDNLADEVGFGYWNGDVRSNSNTIVNLGGGVWTGNILANAGYIANDRTAGYSFADKIGVGVWTGDVSGNTGSVENRGHWYGDITGNSFWVYNTGYWEGDVTEGNTGSVMNMSDDYKIEPADRVHAVFAGTVQGNNGTIFNRGADWNGDVETNTGTIQNSRGIVNDAMTGDSKWTGKVVTNAGTITNAEGSSWTGDVLANTGTIDTQGLWSGNFTNGLGGTVKARGQLVGAVDNAGIFAVTGSLAGITTFENSGTLDLRSSAAAGQVVSVGAANLLTGSTLLIGLDTDGNTDRLEATTANLGGSVTVTINPVVGNDNDYAKTYTILTANNLTGVFDGVSTDLAFLTPDLDYDTPGAVKLTLVQNDQSFDSVAATPNQRSAAFALQALGSGNTLHDAIVPLTAEAARSAFGQLSGMSLLASQTAYLQSSNLVPGIVTRRVEQSLATAGTAERPAPHKGIWAQAYGAFGSVEATAVVAGLDSRTGGIVAGMDGEVGNWRFGALLRGGATRVEVPGLATTIDGFDYGAGLYGGAEFGSTRLAFGGNYTRHDIDTSRSVLFPGFDETLEADYGAGTTQAFARLSHEFAFGDTSLMPYGSVEYVRLATDAYTETGGAAALGSASSTIDATFITLGLNASQKFELGDGLMLTANGGAGWRHGLADTPHGVMRFAGGTAVTVVGNPTVEDLFVLNAGLDLELDGKTMLGLNYDGQIASEADTHSLKAGWSTRF